MKCLYFQFLYNTFIMFTLESLTISKGGAFAVLDEIRNRCSLVRSPSLTKMAHGQGSHNCQNDKINIIFSSHLKNCYASKIINTAFGHISS
jgi:hypothetical protein